VAEANGAGSSQGASASLFSAIAFRGHDLAIASLEPVVHNKQDCPEDSGHWELRGSDSEALLQSSARSLYLKDVLCSHPGSVGNYRENI